MANKAPRTEQQLERARENIKRAHARNEEIRRETGRWPGVAEATAASQARYAAMREQGQPRRRRGTRKTRVAARPATARATVRTPSTPVIGKRSERTPPATPPVALPATASPPPPPTAGGFRALARKLARTSISGKRAED